MTPRLIGTVIALALTAPAIAQDRNDDPACTAAPVAQALIGQELGELTFGGGFHLVALEPDFGEISGIVMQSADEGETGITGVSDQGYAIGLFPVTDGEIVTGVGCVQDPLRDASGAPVSGRERDAEGLTTLADGRRAVSFERVHRIEIHAPDLTGRDGVGPAVMRLDRLENNRGLEALATLPNGDVIAGAESPSLLGHPHPVWRFAATDDPNQPFAAGEPAFSIATEPGFALVGLDVTPAGDVIVLQRFFTRETGNRTRIAWLPGEAVEAAEPGSVLRAVTLARWRRGDALPADNFEGVAAAPGDASSPPGTTRLWVVSDDNLSRSQRTLLYLFTFNEAEFAEIGRERFAERQAAIEALRE